VIVTNRISKYNSGVSVTITLEKSTHTDKEIDNLVYNLYGLTEEERKIVEGGQKS
jgi:hypothetical protein